MSESAAELGSSSAVNPDLPALSVEGDSAASNRPGTNAVNRSWNDLDIKKWVVLILSGAALRSTLMHPFYLAMARKRVGVENHKLRTILSDLKAQPGGRRNWFRGYPCEVTGNAVGETVHLLALEYVREGIHSWWERTRSKPQHSKSQILDNDQRSYGRDALGGIVGDAAAIAVVTPFSVICNRQMTAGYGICREMPYLSVRKTFQSLWMEGRLSALYKGASASLAMLPGAAIWWASYGEFKYWIYRAMQSIQSPTNDPSANRRQDAWWKSTADNPFINGLASAGASAICVAAMNPVNVIRTRMQASSLRATAAIQDLWRTNGWRGFYKGTLLSMNVAVLDGVLFSLLYEFTKLGSDTTRS
jgi:hypothetical protein